MHSGDFWFPRNQNTQDWGSLKPDNDPGFSLQLAVRGSKWEENLFFLRIGHCCSNEIPERSGHKGG